MVEGESEAGEQRERGVVGLEDLRVGVLRPGPRAPGERRADRVPPQAAATALSPSQPRSIEARAMATTAPCRTVANAIGGVPARIVRACSGAPAAERLR
ncbi:MAG TPA: hypothetical protein VK951_01800 [Miltoncostaeaceae bacterium]|nr:hypothetical protein [Miltoncostaeaceae bacterium]